MFAVPGWSISADILKTQTDVSAKKPEKCPIADSNGTSPTIKTSKKRKRGPEKGNATAITSENLAELWEKHIEGRSAVKKNGKVHTTEDTHEKRKEKRTKGKEKETKQSTGDEVEHATGVKHKDKSAGKEDFQKRKQLKEEKRAKKARLQANGDLPPLRPKSSTTQEPQVSKAPSKEAPKAISEPTSNTSNLLSTSSNSTRGTPSLPAPAPAPTSTLTPLQTSMRTKLLSSRFRHLNQTLYTTPSSASLALFAQTPSLFSEYHQGFSQQVAAWPENPVEGFIRWILERGFIGLKGTGLGSQKAQFRTNKKGKGGADVVPVTTTQVLVSTNSVLEPLPRDRRANICTIADLGCGTAHLAATLTPSVKSLQLKLHSFDLSAPSPLVTVADISALPLPPASVDVAIFSLALMGTNWLDFVDDSWRVLKWKGECWIAEVGSRFVGQKELKKGEKVRVGHSVGNRTKFGTGKAKGGDKKGHAADNGEEEDLTVVEAEPSVRSPAQTTADVSAFVEVLRLRGFVLKGEPELGNKMFVRLRFLKGLTPVKGRNAPGKGGEVGNEDVEVEGKVLKACVYKTR